MLSRSANTTRNHDLVVLSHLRWTWVWQRPQHLVSRFADHRSKEGARTYFVEEPVVADVEAPELCAEERDGVTRVWLAVPAQEGRSDAVGFDSPAARDYAPLLARLLSELGTREVDVLLYTPMALEIAQRLEPSRLHYDVMDDLASFLGAPEGLRLLQRRTLTEADVVFAGGRSLHQSVSQHRNGPVHLFPSGVETAHFAASRALREKHSRPVAGYVGVIDERLDLSLLAGLAERLSDWTIRVVGPVAKIDPKSLPRARNLEYPGMAAYEELPAVMAGFDVALMPFALNQATRSISPTKTLEYLAAGLPVVSTRVPDVVADFPGLVHLADTDQGFARTCRHVLHHPTGGRDPLLHSVLTRHEWDHIASVMQALMAGTASSFEPVEAQA